jgi:hypothetical protein
MHLGAWSSAAAKSGFTGAQRLARRVTAAGIAPLIGIWRLLAVRVLTRLISTSTSGVVLRMQAGSCQTSATDVAEPSQPEADAALWLFRCRLDDMEAMIHRAREAVTRGDLVAAKAIIRSATKAAVARATHDA